jgi:D-3-phosphoglycerate dehydrogenase / 2-oxoglutarate reductase
MTASNPRPYRVALLDDFLDTERLAAHVGTDVRQLAGVAAPQPDVEVLVTAEQAVTDALLESFPGLRGVVTASIGFDHLDLDALRRRGIIACNAPGYCTEEVADHALASVLALWRGVPRLSREVASGQWDPFGGRKLKRVSGATLGIVGLGRIGRRLAAKAAPLGMRLLGHDPFVANEELRGLDIELTSLEVLLAHCDGVSLHVPGQPSGAPLLGAPELDLLAPTAVLVNVARASLVDLDALCDRLGSGRLAGALLDVWDTEPPQPDDVRLRCRNLFITPHAAWYSPQAEASLYAEVSDAVSALLAGDVPSNSLA